VIKNWYYRQIHFARKVIFFSKEFFTEIFDAVLFSLRIYDTVLSKQPGLENTIVITGLELNHRVIKNCKYLKKYSPYKTILLIHQQSSILDLETDFYDALIRFRNKKHLKRILFCSDKLKLIYGFASKASYARAAFENAKCPKMFDPYDCVVVYYGLNPKQHWMQKEILHEKYCFENSNAVLARNLEINKSYEIYALNKKKTILFSDYCDNDAFVTPEKTERNSMSIVYSGGIYGKHMLKSSHGIENFFDFINSMDEQKINFHIYPSPQTKPEIYFDYIEESKRLKHLYLHKTVSQKELSKEISKYHFGVLPHFKEESSFVSTDKLERGTSNKFFNFLEAGLPILISKDMSYMSWLVNRYNIGIVFSKNDISKLATIINDANYSELQKNVLVVREKLSMNYNLKRLTKFIENI
jgi:glycosyltransferase involved in cell wall biosynthesis